MASKQTDKKKTHSTQAKNHTTRSRTNQTNRTHKPKAQEPVVNESIRDEVILIITFLISLLLVLSYFHLCGPLGNFINKVIFGLIGYFTYLFPFALFFMVAFILSNRGSKVAKRKIIGSIVLLFALTALIQLLGGYDPETNFFSYFSNSSKNLSGGGLIGGVLVCILCPLFDITATYIILIAMILLCSIFITGKAILTLMRRKGEEKIQKHMEQRAMYEDEYEQLDMEDMKYREPKQHRARVVTLQKPDKSLAQKLFGDEEEDDLLGEENENEPISFLDELKIKGQGVTKTEQENTTLQPITNNIQKDQVELQEFTSDEIEHFEPSHQMLNEVNTIYEEELNRKFGLEEEQSVPEAAVKPVAEAPVVEATWKEESTLAKESSQASKVKATSTEEPVDLGEINQNVETVKKYEFPPIDLLGKPKPGQKGMTDRDLRETANKLHQTLESFGVRVTITNVSCGPAVTRYELQPDQGVSVSKITKLADDIKLNLAAADIRIEAPIPGKAAVGIEVPNKENSAVMLRELLDTKEFKSHPSDIAFAVGKDIGGQAVVTDIAKMPHLLIAGATGSGKSVCINTLIMSILYKANPADVRMIMVDPKVVELSVYNGIPHLLIPVVTDPKKASAALNWAVMEMTDRYKKFADLSVRDLKGYNERVKEVEYLNDPAYQKLPQIVIIVDELADLMMVAPGEVEDAICRLAQMARAAGLHLIIATQRPSVNVITGLIKANVPSRIAFSVSSAIDSRTIIDSAGAEKLLGKGDMLFFPSGYSKPVRVQGAFVSDKEVSAVVDFLKEQNGEHTYNEEINNKIASVQTSSASSAAGGSERDDYFVEAGKFIIDKDKASIGMLQRVYKIGFNRAARIMEQLADAGVVGPEEGTKPRKILMSLEEFEQYVDEYV